MDKDNNLQKARNFAVAMSIKYTKLLKEWQHHAINILDDYCHGKINEVDVIKFINSYHRTLNQFEYWTNEVSWLNFCINEVNVNAKSNDTNRQN